MALWLLYVVAGMFTGFLTGLGGIGGVRAGKRKMDRHFPNKSRPSANGALSIGVPKKWTGLPLDGHFSGLDFACSGGDLIRTSWQGFVVFPF